MLAGLLRRRREARERVHRDARDLLTFLGDGAYAEARTRARECRAKRDREGDRHWGRVAVEIARITGREIGKKVADRYAEARKEERSQPNRRAIIAELLEISEAIRDLSRGKTDATALHNAEAAVHRLVEFAPSPTAEAAGRDLRAALAELAAGQTENVSALRDGIYPPRAEKAGKALERLRDIVMPTRTA